MFAYCDSGINSFKFEVIKRHEFSLYGEGKEKWKEVADKGFTDRGIFQQK